MEPLELKKISDISFDANLQKYNALKKAQSDLITVYNNHIFRADAHTICLTRTLAETHKEFYLLDTNDNPVRITDPQAFLATLIARNQSALNTYHQLHQTLKNRKV